MSLYLGTNLISGVATPVEGARNIGQIVQSTIPLTDAGLHLLDGSLISGSGSYTDFVTYISNLDLSSGYFCTEAEWQTSVTNYGVCDKFVYDSVNNTVRLPKRISEHGALIKSYSSGMDWYRIYSDGWCEQGGYIVGSTNTATTVNLLKSMPNTEYVLVIGGTNNTNSRSSGNPSYRGIYQQTGVIESKATDSFVLGNGKSITWQAFGYIDISDYQYSPIYEYLVIATSTKTAIEVDIDEIATDLNGKADVDLTNCTKPHIVDTYENDTDWYRIYSDGWCEQGGLLAAQTISAGYSANQNLTFLVEMKDINYTIVFGCFAGAFPSVRLEDRTTQGGTVIQYNRAGSGSASTQHCWQVSGYKKE